ncbi:MAG: FumA C-terminus/TtdB family hydratase beta subunit [Candidatus Cloacimonadaceae bacterium]|nr:FumA C-terminus/TtdB family hydratase beta subunit [Candidatus Cloacimonadota bacterium]MDX9949514.1 FumA C-terminus/TtdB family hydratase beta subunit [Candidatus Syntrophosphaera sp.]
MRQHNLLLPLKSEEFAVLQPGDKVLLSGVLYTARDQAHKRLVEIIARKSELPFDLSSTALFYCGPSPTPPGKVCGAIGPTTSSRMDPYTIPLLEQGLKIMIGKGERSAEVEDAIRKHGALYLVCCGGISALLAESVLSFELFAWPELGAEAIYRLEVRDLPCYVAIC